jgi:hypothetical protein
VCSSFITEKLWLCERFCRYSEAEYLSKVFYHKGPDVREFLARPDCRIHLIQVPPSCPHLNPIKRLWAVMHQFVTHNRRYPTQKQVANAMLKFFRETIPNE